MFVIPRDVMCTIGNDPLFFDCLTDDLLRFVVSTHAKVVVGTPYDQALVL